MPMQQAMGSKAITRVFNSLYLQSFRLQVQAGKYDIHGNTIFIVFLQVLYYFIYCIDDAAAHGPAAHVSAAQASAMLMRGL